MREGTLTFGYGSCIHLLSDTGKNEDEGSANILDNAGSVHSLLSSSRGDIPIPHICGQIVLLLFDSFLLSALCVGRKPVKMIGLPVLTGECFLTRSQEFFLFCGSLRKLFF